MARLLARRAAPAWPARRRPSWLQVNGGPALIVRIDGEIDVVVSVRIDDGLISGLYIVRNPEKLSRVEREIAVRR